MMKRASLLPRGSTAGCRQTTVLGIGANKWISTDVCSRACLSCDTDVCTDEIWYDPTSGNYFVTGADGSGNRVFDVISDSTDTVIQSVLLPVSSLSNPHSISVDPVSGDVFVPLAGNTTSVGGSACALGCIAVFGVPEPGTLPVLLFGGVLMLGLGAHRRGPHVGRSLLRR
jgi:hypothetical protein